MNILDNIILFDRIQKDAMEADQLYMPAPYWRAYSERIARHISSKGLMSFRSDYGLTKGYIMAGVNELVIHPRPKLKSIVDICSKIPIINLLFQYYESRLVFFNNKAIESYQNYYDILVQLDERVTRIKDDGVGNPVMLEDRQGVSLPLIYALNYYLLLDKSVDLNSIRRIKEVGAGYGALAEVILKARFDTIDSYFIYDIPPLCYIAAQYLKAVFGSSTVGDYVDYLNGDLKKVMVLPSWLYNKETSSDLLINTASFQEMDQEKITNYIEKCNSEHIFCITLTNGHKKNANGQLASIGANDIIKTMKSCNYSANIVNVDEPMLTITRFMDLKYYSTIVAKKCE
jgi:putative sugar O-methyltransferase